MKALLDMETEQVEALSRICKRDGISRAEAIRRAIDYYAAHTLQAGSIDEHFGHFRGKPVDAFGYVDSLRNDW